MSDNVCGQWAPETGWLVLVNWHGCRGVKSIYALQRGGTWECMDPAVTGASRGSRHATFRVALCGRFWH